MSAIINALKTSLESDPENWETRLALIQACHSEEMYDDAVEAINSAESLPSDDAGLVNAAKCYEMVGASDQAHGIYAAALDVNPENEDAKNAIERIQGQDAAPVEVVEDDDVAVAVVADEDSKEATDTSGVAVAAVPLTPPDQPDAAPQPITAPQPDAAPQPDPPAAQPAVAVAAAAQPIATAKAGQKAPAPVIVRSVEEIDPELIAEAEFIHNAEEESERKAEKARKRDKFNAVALTVVIHVAIIAALMMVATQVVRPGAPQIVASTQPDTKQDEIQTETMKRPTQQASASSAALTDIVSVQATSSFAFSDVQVEGTASMGFSDTGMDFAPSMDVGMQTSSDSKMMFGQKMEGDVLGVILDVSGSMAEYLPHVVREVDKNFKDAPIVYVRNVVMRQRTKDPDVRLIIPEEVRPHDEDRNRTPYWFLWHDLPRKAPQRYVDRLIDTFKTRPNQFLAIRSGGDYVRGDYVTSAIDFLVEQKIDSLYIFSDFEDFVDEEMAEEIGKNLGRRKIKTYVQPAEKKTDNLNIMTNKIARRTLGRQMPTLVSIFRPEDDEPKPLTLSKPKDMSEESLFNFATPRDEMIGKEWYQFRPNANMTEITRMSEPAFDAVFYGPEARAEIFLKDENGGYIQNPIRFYYHSWKKDPEKMKDPAYHGRRRKFLKLQEPPSFDGKEIVWKMILEDDLKFNVHMYITGIGKQKLAATYTAEPPKDGTPDHAHVSFWIPRLAYEKKDVYFGQDLPAEGLTDLDDIRAGAKFTTVAFNLDKQNRDRYKKRWALDGFEPGINVKRFDELIRVLPSGIRDLRVEGASFGPRKLVARTSSNKILLTGWAGRADIEPWEGFAASIVRSGDTREKFTKTEAIQFVIE